MHHSTAVSSSPIVQSVPTVFISSRLGLLSSALSEVPAAEPSIEGDGVVALHGVVALPGVVALHEVVALHAVLALGGVPSLGGVLALTGVAACPSVQVTLVGAGGGEIIFAFFVGPPAESASVAAAGPAVAAGGAAKQRFPFPAQIPGFLPEGIPVLHAPGTSFFCKANTWQGWLAFGGGAGSASWLGVPSGPGVGGSRFMGGGGTSQPAETIAGTGGALAFALPSTVAGGALGGRLAKCSLALIKTNCAAVRAAEVHPGVAGLLISLFTGPGVFVASEVDIDKETVVKADSASVVVMEPTDADWAFVADKDLE
ncbi:hypothetical protein AK812_SmicGene16941 [Symbiodinium microadriaticum]|uniref:Uncharacterized protein n=1 Tax=Symbiodinium microadriaticum TaxID=2951 RepID=A0A1Q9DYZ2_SYMMI|nr:hypothetical protein AK812_SmicGene16941 [Symbiodinium microadriaticum]